jgi:hypothetical protein
MAGLMSAWVNRACDHEQITSGLSPEADIFDVGRHVSKGPED